MTNMPDSIFQIMAEMPFQLSPSDRSLYFFHCRVLLTHPAFCFVNAACYNSSNEELQA